jgi:hypothetical protein
VQEWRAWAGRRCDAAFPCRGTTPSRCL